MRLRHKASAESALEAMLQAKRERLRLEAQLEAELANLENQREAAMALHFRCEELQAERQARKRRDHVQADEA